MKNHWINWAIEAQIVVFEEAEYYGIYDPNLFDTAFWMVSFKLIEIWSQILFEKIAVWLQKLDWISICRLGKD